MDFHECNTYEEMVVAAKGAEKRANKAYRNYNELSFQENQAWEAQFAIVQVFHKLKQGYEQDAEWIKAYDLFRKAKKRTQYAFDQWQNAENDPAYQWAKHSREV